MHTTIAHQQIPAASTNPSRLEAQAGSLSNIITRLPRIMAWGVFLLGMSLLGLRLAGYELIYLRGNSMEPTLSAGSLLLARPAPPEDIRVGDIVAFPSGAEGIPNIVHRVIALQGDVLSRQVRIARTIGDNNPILDPEPLILDQSLTRVVLEMPYIGWWITPTLGWYFLGVGVVLGLMAALQISVRRGRQSGTNGLPPMVPTSGVGCGRPGVFLHIRNASLARPLRGPETAERCC